MFSFRRIRSITIEFDSLLHFLEGSSGNRFQAQDIPAYINQAVAAGVAVFITDAEGERAYRLGRDGDWFTLEIIE